MSLRRIFAVTAVVATLGACGDTALEQSVMGAGAGAVGAAVLDTNLATGALVGAVSNVAFCQKYPSRC